MLNQKRIFIRLSIVIISFFLWPLISSSQPAVNDNPDLTFPFLAEVNQNQINVRAGQSPSFEKLCQMNKGDEVIVLEQNFSWYKIRLPQRCRAFIIEKYVEKTGIDRGKVIGQHVNIRAQAKAESTSLGMLEKDSEIKILEKKEGWYKIKPPDNSFAWIAGQFVTFKSNDIGLYHEPEIIEPKSASSVQVNETGLTLNAGIPENVMEISGILEKSSNSVNKDCLYQISNLGTVKYHLKTNLLLDKWVGQKVNVKGVLDVSLGQPLLDVYQIRLNY